MGLLQAYAIYKYGKSRQKKRQRKEEEYWAEVCEHCGYARAQHADNEEQTCPIYS